MKKLSIKEAEETLKNYDLSRNSNYTDLSAELSLADNLIINICNNIVRYKREKNLSGSELAAKLKTNESKVSYINTRSIKKLNLEELLGFMEELKDDHEIERSLSIVSLSF